MKKDDSNDDHRESNAPMVEIFGGVFALLLVLFMIITLLSQASLMERLEATNDEGLYKIGWGADSSGYIIITFPSELRIIETRDVVNRGEICDPRSAFVKYASKVYQATRDQIIFAIVDDGVATMAEARNCMLKIMPDRPLHIGWIIANNELLKSVSLDDIPPYIENVVK